MILDLQNIYKDYQQDKLVVPVLKDVSFQVEEGEYVAIMGESGSGKTTLLNILASLDRPTSGEVLLEGKNIDSIRDGELSAFRRNHLGFVFQDFNLLDNFSVRDNIFLPLVLSRSPFQEMNRRLIPLAKMLGISEILQKYPYEISGGQKQRAAVARALITQPRIILAVRTQVRSPRAINRFRTPFPIKVIMAMAKIKSGNAWKISMILEMTLSITPP